VPQFRDPDQPLGTFRQLNDEEKEKSYWSELREDLNAESREHERGEKARALKDLKKNTAAPPRQQHVQLALRGNKCCTELCLRYRRRGIRRDVKKNTGIAIARTYQMRCKIAAEMAKGIQQRPSTPDS